LVYITEEITQNENNTMSNTVTLYKCDSCKDIIRDPKDGLVIHGNIYVADPDNRGGLIGNNFPTEPSSSGIYPKCEDQVGEIVMCNNCFFKAVFPDKSIVHTRSGILA